MRGSLTSRRFSQRLSTWALRASYILSLFLIGAICAYFFVQQRSQNAAIGHISALAEQFTVLDKEMNALASQSESIARRFPAERQRSDPRMDGMTLAERRAFIAAMPPDPEIRPSKLRLVYIHGRAQSAMHLLRARWRVTPAELRNQIMTTSRYMATADPFQYHDAMLDQQKVDSANTRFDLHWTARQIGSLYENNVAPSNYHAQIEIRSYLEDLSRKQGVTLQNFFLITLGALGGLLLLVFIPVDIIIQRIMRRLDAKQKETDAAMVKALAADRAKSEFLANMSHEIRTPMNGVLGMAEILSKTDLTAKQRTFTDVIVKSGNALLTIINDILDFSKIDANQIELHPAPFNLSETVEDVATLISGRLAEKDLELIVRVQPGLPHALSGDVGRIRQVLTNLIGNAVKFTELGHVLVDVSGTVEENVARVTFTVEDTGIGIPADKLASVFDKFSQVDASSTRRHEGTGLGLAIARRLIQLMGSDIEAASTYGKGSRFWFTIELPVHEHAVSRRKIVPVDISGAGILIIEDNAINRSILVEQFESWRFDCAAVEDGHSGLAFLREADRMGAHIDLIVLDYQMPSMTGEDVATAIRSDPAIADTPILVLSSVDQMESMRFIRELAIEGHLSKPARSSLLLETVTAIIQESRHRGADAAPSFENTPPQQMPEPREQERPQAPPAAATQRKTEGIDILVAEDNEVNQIVFTQALQELPISFKIVGNGRLALMEWEMSRPALILMDVSMPEMNGHEATIAIRRREAELDLKRTPIIGVTAHALNGDREKCIEAGMDDYLSKPISPDKLAEKVYSWLDAGAETRRSA